MLRILVGAALLGALVLIQQTQSCNEAVCGSIVSKCLLTQSCKCDLKNCTCCKDCFNCLSYLYNECCSCVEMCPKPNDTYNLVSQTSLVGDFKDNVNGEVNGLFTALTDFPDAQNRWDSFTFPFDVALSEFPLIKEMKFRMQSSEQDVAPKSNMVTLNCTVAYLSGCLSSIKCKSSCNSMGATSYRWFHNGCCECVGQHCLNYGINESRCRKCPGLDDDDDDDDLSEDQADYGEDDDDFLDTNE